MNTDQLRAEFEAWADNHHYLSELNNIYLDDDYVDSEMQAAWEGYQAGRAALQSQQEETQRLRDALWVADRKIEGLQSQDREDAERYRAWRKAVASQNGNFLRLVSNELPDWGEGPVDEEKIDAAIDHARRI